MKVSYDADVRARAKAEKSVIVTLDIDGRCVPRGSGTTQGTVTDQGAVKYLWEVFAWLTDGLHNGKSAPVYTPPKPAKAKPLKGK